MATMRVSDFMVDLSKKLIADKGISESSASLYIKNLWTLNDKQPFNNLAFLKNTDAVDEKLGKYAESTKKTFLASIVSVLSLYKTKATYKSVHQHYYDKMMDKAKEMKASESDEKTDKQKDNWISWEDVTKIRDELKADVESFVSNKLITPQQYNKLLSYVILSLYAEIPPRRNADYADMYVVGKWNDKMDTSKNYLDMSTNKLIFNKYKTAKKYGMQTEEMPSSLVNVVSMYLKHHPLHKGKITKATEFRFLVYSDGSPLSAVNSITRILNKVFGKKVGSSMLRHIYLSNKYDIADMKDTAEAMGHSVDEALRYAKA